VGGYFRAISFRIFLQTYSNPTQFSVRGAIFHIGMGESYLIMEDQDLEYFRGILTQSLDDLLKKGDETVSLLKIKWRQLRRSPVFRLFMKVSFKISLLEKIRIEEAFNPKPNCVDMV
jgi:hypothetical protein